MTNKFSAKSIEKLNSCDERLQFICYEVLKEMDIAILEGARGKELQNKAYEEKRSQLKYPDSKHNVGREAGRMKSHAVDIAPYPIDWNNIKRFEEMLLIVERIAKENNIKIRLGRDFSFKDYPHIELVEKI